MDQGDHPENSDQARMELALKEHQEHVERTGGFAFPVGMLSAAPGMTLRDYFAGQCIAAGCEQYRVTRTGDVDPDLVARGCYEMADAMLRARKAVRS